MKLFYSPTSPFVRKVMVAAHELNLADGIERLKAAPHPVNRDLDIVRFNPLGQVPTLVCPDGTAIFDSRSISEYLDSQSQAAELFPADERRWAAMSRQAAADGLLGAAINSRYELSVRDESERSEVWLTSQRAKMEASMDYFAAAADSLHGAVDIGTISIGCALGYVDFRFGHLDWRATRPTLAEWYAEFAARPSMTNTAPQA